MTGGGGEHLSRDRVRFKVATERGVFLGDSPEAATLAARADGAARSPSFQGAAGVYTWLDGRWWAWAAGAWVPLARSSAPRVQWGPPEPLSPAFERWARGELEATGLEPVCEPLGDGRYALLTAERGRVVVRIASSTPSSGGELAPPPAPETVEPFRDWRDSMRKAAAQISRDFRRRRVIEDAARVVAPVLQRGTRGRPDNRALMLALFEDQKKRAPFRRDPQDTELIGSTEAILCLDPDGVCLLGGDCDDQIVALVSRALAVGVNARLRARKYVGQVQPHVYVEYEAKKDKAGAPVWAGIDPSVEDGKPSERPYEQEWIETIDTTPQFVGLGDPPEDDAMMLGDATTTATDASAAASSSSSSSNLQPMDAATAAAWVSVLQGASDGFNASLAALQVARASYMSARVSLGLPSTDDASGSSASSGSSTGTDTGGGSSASATPLADYIASVNQEAGNWTSAADSAEQELIAAASFMSGVMADGLSGARRLIFDAQGTIEGMADLFIESQSGDTYRILLVKQTDGTYAPEYFDTSTGQATATLGAVWEWIAGAAIVAVISVATSIAVTHYMDSVRAAHNADLVKHVSDNQKALIQSGQMTPDQATAQASALLSGAAALNAPSQPPATGDSLSNVAKWGAVGAIAVASVFGMYFLVKIVDALPKRSAARA